MDRCKIVMSYFGGVTTRYGSRRDAMWYDFKVAERTSRRPSDFEVAELQLHLNSMST